MSEAGIDKDKPKIGLLAFYLELYDRTIPDMRPQVEEFYRIITAEFKRSGIEVIISRVCRIKKEFREAMDLIQKNNADAVVTLHLAYSPSLESADILQKSDIPLIILDTTPKYDFDSNILPDDILYNHGIHGVQDLCNILLRRGRQFILETGHWKESDIIDRVSRHIYGAFILNRLRSSRTGIIGNPFDGMGDFNIPFETLKKTLGIEVIQALPEEIAEYMPDAGDVLVKNEMDVDRKRFDIIKLNNRVHLDNTRICLAVRKWIQDKSLSSFTMNFSEIGPGSGFPTLPFLEASKAMARGIGYAGEGDVFTASLVGSILKVFPETTFSEMFCPDWKNQRIFLSHMGEVNIDLIEGMPRLREKEMPFLDVGNPVLATGGLKPGKAIFVNLAPIMGDDYTLILSEINIDRPGKLKNIDDTIYGWLVPGTPLQDFLYDFSMAGGTHHSAIIYNGNIEILKSLSLAAGWKTRVI